MPSSAPRFEIVGKFELTDEFIDALADLLIEVGDKERAAKASDNAQRVAALPTNPSPK